MSRLWKMTLLALLLGTSAAGAASPVPWRTFTSSYTHISSSGDVTVDDSAGLTGLVRSEFFVPSRWKILSAPKDRTTRLYAGGSCRFKVRYRPRLVQADEQPAPDRVVALLPATASYVRVSGTRETAAFRVIRVKGSTTVRGALVQPLPASSTPGVAEGKRIYAEISATGTADPKTECHAGGPRTIADSIGDGFAGGSAGGFLDR